MDNELKFVLKVWVSAVIGGSLLSTLIMLPSNFTPEIFLMGLFILFFAATRGIPSLILFYIATTQINRTAWKNKIKIILLAIIGALICFTNIILFLFRKKLDEILHLSPIETFTILGFAGIVMGAVFYFKKQLFEECLDGFEQEVAK